MAAEAIDKVGDEREEVRGLMRVVVTTQPALGHLHPLVPLSRAMADAGHDVRLVSSASFQPQLERTGLPTASAGLDWLESEATATFPALNTVLGDDGKRYFLDEIFCGTAELMAEDLIGLARRWRPDVIVREIWEFGGAVAAAILGVPCVVHGIGRWLNVEEVVDAGAARLSRLWSSSGFTGDDLNWVDGDLYLDVCPPSLDLPTRRPRPPFTRSLRPVPFDDTSTPGPSPPARRGGRPLIHVSLGTVSSRVDVLNAILRDLRDLDADVVATTGNCDPVRVEPQPPSITVTDYVPLTRLLPSCDLVICHGGWGTVIAAAAHGVPVVCVPAGADRPANAHACETAGMGLTIRPDHLQPGRVRAAAAAILDGGTHRAGARQVHAEIDRMPSPQEIAQAVEGLV